MLCVVAQILEEIQAANADTACMEEGEQDLEKRHTDAESRRKALSSLHALLQVRIIHKKPTRSSCLQPSRIVSGFELNVMYVYVCHYLKVRYRRQ
jgi:hypothetical protein